MSRKPIWPPPIYPARGGKERMRVYIDGKPKDIVLGPAGSEEARTEYRRQLAIIQENGGARTEAREVSTVALVCARFLAQARIDHGDDWPQLLKYESAFRPLLSLMNHQPATKLDAEAIEHLQRIMASGSWMGNADRVEAEKYKRPIGWARSMINSRIGRIKAAWRWAEAKKLIPHGTYAHLLTAKSIPANARWCRSTPKRTATERADLDKVLVYCPAPIAAMLELQWLSGMRSGEVRLMRGDLIDRKGDVWSYLPLTDKNAWRGDPVRPVALGPACQEILAPWLKASDGGYLFRPLMARRRRNGTAPPVSEDIPYSERAYPQAVERACQRAGVKIIPHGLRHAAKERITRQEGLDAARAVLRQKSVEATAHYGNVDAEHARDVMRRRG